MNIPAPAIRWPAEFTAAGPPRDPAIVLTAEARIGDTAFRVTALRMREGLRLPDYRTDVPESAYEEAFERMVDDIEDLVDARNPHRVAINNAEYLLWMVPACVISS